jgi:acetolactate synthase I/III small subunit
MNAHQTGTGSAYFLDDKHETSETHTLGIVAENQPGVLARIIGLFAGRGYNIDSLTVSETEHEKHVSRFTIVTRGTPTVITQIKHQLERMVPVHSVADHTVNGNYLARELAMVKVAGKGDKRVEALRLPRPIHSSSNSRENRTRLTSSFR